MTKRFYFWLPFIVTAFILSILAPRAQQQNGTPDQIRIKTDANGYLLVVGAAQTSPISQPSQFSNTRLKTDASGNLLVVFTGGPIIGTVSPDVICLDSTNADTCISRDSAGIAALKRITGAATFRIYGGTNFWSSLNADTSGNFNFNIAEKQPVAATTALSGTAGTLNIGNHTWKVTFVSPSGETDGGTVSAAVTTTDALHSADLSVIPTGSNRVTARKIYRNKIADQTHWFLVTTIADNSTTTLNDGVADASLTTAIPTTNTAIETRAFLAMLGGMTFGGALNQTTTSTDGISLVNTTASTIGATVHMSPRFRLSGTAYNSTSTLSETNSFFFENLPATVAGTITGTLKIGYVAPNGTVTYPETLGSNGNLGISASLFLSVAAPGGIQFGGGSFARLSSPADGQLNIFNGGNTAGIGLDVTTDSTVKIRTRAQTGYGTVDALNFTASGTAGLAGPVTCTTVTSITVKGGIITAIAGAGC